MGIDYLPEKKDIFCFQGEDQVESFGDILETEQISLRVSEIWLSSHALKLTSYCGASTTQALNNPTNAKFKSKLVRFYFKQKASKHTVYTRIVWKL